MLKREKELLRDRCEDTSGFKAENDDINNDPNLNDSEIRIALYESRRRYVKQKMDSYNEECRWYNEIREEEERKAEMAELVKPAKTAKLAKLARTTEESEDESESKSESEDFGPDESDSD